MRFKPRRRAKVRPQSARASTLEVLERRALLSAALPPVPVIDLNVATADAAPARFVAGSGAVLFTATDGVGGTELWRTDGTAAGTMLLKDINPGAASSSPMTFGALPGGVTVFVADDGVHGLELWRTDGTAAGTHLLKDINPGAAKSQRGINLAGGPQQFDRACVIDGVAYFEANDGTSGYQLWRTDGTADGTFLVKNVNPYASPSLTALTAFNGALYFTVLDASGTELWKSDGTADGTAMLKDINPGSATAGVRTLTVSGGSLYFAATDGVSGTELWKTDGTTDGTVRVKDINPGAGGASATILCDVAGTLFFIANDGTGSELWKSNGTEVGTVQVTDLAIKLDSFTAVGGTLFFVGAPNGGPGRELWKSDGTSAGTIQVKDINPGITSSNPTSLTAFNGQLYFAATDPTAGTELWRSDGTEAGTVRLKDIYAGPATGGTAGFGSSSPASLTAVGSTLYFAASDAMAGREVWRSDGSEAGTVRVADVNTITLSSSPSAVWEINGRLVFGADDRLHGRELFVTDGTAAGTTLLKDFVTGPGIGVATFAPARLGGYLYFAAGTNAQELWRTDGTPAGTTLVRAFTTNGIARLASVGGQLLFWANDGISGIELWKSDGTFDGTEIVADLRAGSASSSALRPFVGVGDIAYFAYNDANGTELWRTDGTAGGTFMVKDINPGSASSNADWMFALDDILLFTAETPAAGNEIWRSDGTAAGTYLLKDIYPGSFGGNAHSFAQLGSIAVFWGSGELWKTDGTVAGTQLIKEIDTGPQHSNPIGMTAWNGAVYFRAELNLTDRELWKTDGTAAGTVRVKDIYPGTGSSSPSSFLAMEDAIYFSANDGVNGSELWKSDGTDAGTVRVADINPGAASGGAGTMARVGSALYFVANDGAHGAELWRLGPAQVPVVTLQPGGTLVVQGTDASDAFSYTAASAAAGGGGDDDIVVTVNGQNWSFPRTQVTAVHFQGYGGDDGLDYRGNAPLPAFTFHGDDGASTLNIEAGECVLIEDAAVGNESLLVHVGTEASVTFATSQHLAALVVDGQARLTPGGEKVLVVGALNIGSAGSLDLTDNDLVIDYDGASVIGSWNGSSYDGVTELIARGYNYSAWDLSGLVTTMPDARAGLTSLALLEASDLLGIAGDQTAAWGGQTVDASSVIVKYTYAGDLNLDGLVDAADYGVIDNWIQFPSTWGYGNGDFNFDGIIDAADYGIIDNSIQMQGPPL